MGMQAVMFKSVWIGAGHGLIGFAPVEQVAKKFGMCTTALKKLCRKYGVMQWPHRCALRPIRRVSGESEAILVNLARRL